MRKWLLILLLTPLGPVLHLFVFHFDTNFHSKDFEHGFNNEYATEVSGLDYDALEPILNQPFHYLGYGKQMVALESADGKYVLKLFNPMRPLKKGWETRWKLWKRYNSLKWISREWFQREARLQKLFIRYKLAFDKLKNETGLVHVHLGPSKRMNHLIHYTDNRGGKQTLKLSTTPFVLQKKAILVPEYFRQLSEGEIPLAIQSLETLFEKRLEVGITDRIQTMGNNYGFVDGQPIQIDVGRIRYEPSLLTHPEEEKERILKNFHDWIISKNF